MAPETATLSGMIDSILSLISEEARRVTAGLSSKRLIIFGSGARGIVLCEALKTIGLSAGYFIDSKDAGSVICGTDVYEPTRIKEETLADIFVLIAADFPGPLISRLEEMGLTRGKEFAVIFDRPSLKMSPHLASMHMLDLFLGFTRNSDLPGFKCHGDTTCDDNLRILILGGSNTDPEIMDPAEWDDPDLRESSSGSWPRFLHEILNAQKIGHTMFNGAMSAYTSAQELLKLVRDGLTLKPDVVIIYDGINDACQAYRYEGRYPKTHSFLLSNARSYFKALETGEKPQSWNRDTLTLDTEGNPSLEGICCGIPSEISSIDEWHQNVRAMNALCREFGIECAVFYQPFGLYIDDYLKSCDVQFRTRWFLFHFFINSGLILRNLAGEDYSKNGNRIYLEKIMGAYLNYIFDYEIDKSKFFKLKYKNYEEFHQKAREIAKHSSFIIDASDVLNGHADILFDDCHVTSKGNKIIAKRIYDELKTNGILGRALAKVSARGKCKKPPKSVKLPS